jgi:hypothetical protein
MSIKVCILVTVLPLKLFYIAHLKFLLVIQTKHVGLYRSVIGSLNAFIILLFHTILELATVTKLVSAAKF